MIEQTATALTNAMPILCATAFPTLLITAITAAMEWHRLGQDDPTWTYDDYQPTDVIWARQHHTPVDAPTQVIDITALTTPVYAQLAAQTARQPIPWHVAHEVARAILVDLGQAARVNGVNTGGAS